MSNQPKISVVVPIYGVEKYLRTALDSIICQTLTDIEIILVDDGGKDKCPQIIDEYAATDPRIIVIHKPNGGYGSACNAGLMRASGEYIAIFEPDDYIEPNMYEELYNVATKNNADIVKSQFYTFFDFLDADICNSKVSWFRGKNTSKPTGVFDIKKHPEFLSFHPSIWSCIYKRSFLEQHNITIEEIPGAGWTDNLFQVQTFLLAQRICFTEDAFYHWRLRQRDDALDLKDLTIPFLRTRTIHKWLRDNNITNEDIWANLYKREIAYMHIVARAGNVKTIRPTLSLIAEWLSDVDMQILAHSKYITKYEIKSVRKMRNFIRFYYLYKIRRFLSKVLHYRRSVLSIHWSSRISPNEQEKIIVICGIMFFRNTPSKDIKHFARIKI
ncbi:MAG: glycosyltransferase [Alphaproteobacteria bacterium]|nr:glycosyltransferase [Alphaproteobacteria bacterium]